MKIWKYTLQPITTINIPQKAQILTAQVQNGEVCLWALVDPSAPKEDRIFEVYGTGHDINYGMGIDRNYISTVQLYGGALVFHVFEYLGI